MSIADVKVHADKFKAELHETKAVLDEFEAHAKKNKAQAEIDAINDLKAKKQEIDKKVEGLKTTGEEKVRADTKAHIETEIAKFKALLQDFRAKHKSHAATK